MLLAYDPPTMNIEKLLPAWAAAALLARHKPAGQLIVFCGAGLSAPSGLTVYRGDNGSWTLSPEAQKAMDMRHWPQSRQEALAHLERWRELVDMAEPNEAHKRIASWKRTWPQNVHVITQNVDGLLQKAGLSDSEVMEVHGSLHRMRCVDCKAEWPWAKGVPADTPCPVCGSLMTKPAVVFFHERAPLYPQMQSVCEPNGRLPGDVFVAIGTSWHVIPPEFMLQTKGRAPGLQIGVDARSMPEMEPWLHEQCELGAVAGCEWAQRKFLTHWRSLR